jgi:hypothetical protein
MPELLPFISLPQRFIAERRAFVGHLDPREPQLLPLMGQEHLSLAVLALHIADCFVLIGDEHLRMRELRGFIEHLRPAVAHEDVEIADESHFLRHDHDKLADKATSLGHADAKLAVVHSRQATKRPNRPGRVVVCRACRTRWLARRRRRNFSRKTSVSERRFSFTRIL